MKRKIEQTLYDWKSDANCPVLIIYGPGRVGKTYSIEKFGRSAYKEYIMLDIASNSADRSIFETESDDEMLRMMGVVHAEFNVIPGESLAFIDNAHVNPRVVDMAKVIADYAKIDVIVAGMIPAGLCESRDEEGMRFVRMYPMDFEEYLWANGVSPDKTRVIRSHISGARPFSEREYGNLDRLFRTYLVVGGLPDAVLSSITDGNTGHDVMSVKTDVLSRIHKRIMNEAPRVYRDKAYDCFVSIPSHLQRKNKRFRYVDVSGSPNVGGREFDKVISWLESLGVVSISRNLKSPVSPLRNHVGRGFKMYSFDTGLLIGMYEGSKRLALYNGDMGVDEGGALENGIANMLRRCGFELYYFERSHRRENGARDDMKADFILESENGLIAAEVRPTPSRSPGTLWKFIAHPDYVDLGVRKLIRLEDSNIRIDDDGILHLPFFASAFMDSLVRRWPVPDGEGDHVPMGGTVRLPQPVVEGVPGDQVVYPDEPPALSGAVLPDDPAGAVEVGQDLDDHL